MPGRGRDLRGLSQYIFQGSRLSNSVTSLGRLFQIWAALREGLVVVTSYRGHGLAIDGGDDHFHFMSFMSFELHLDISCNLRNLASARG